MRAQSGVVDVARTPAKQQAIGNCWLYATTGLAESLHKEATGEEWDLSENYLTYWMLYERISAATCASDLLENGELKTGGGEWVEEARETIDRRGLMLEGDFGEDRDGAVVAAAVEKLSAKLRDDRVARSAVARHDRKAIRAMLDEAWSLPEGLRQGFDASFGAEGRSDFRGCTGAACAPLVDGRVARASIGGERVSLRDALDDYVRVPMPQTTDPSEFRRWERAVQRSLHARAPVPISWIADSADAVGDGLFSRGEADIRDITSALSEGTAGGHASLIVDYGAENVPGVGSLAAGEVASAADMAAAMSDETVITVMRMKNSWGEAAGVTRTHFEDTGYTDLGRGVLRGLNEYCQDVAEGGSTTGGEAAEPKVCEDAPSGPTPQALRLSAEDPGDATGAATTSRQCGYVLSVMDVMVPRRYVAD